MTGNRSLISNEICSVSLIWLIVSAIGHWIRKVSHCRLTDKCQQRSPGPDMASVVQRLHVFRWKDPHPASAATPPAQGARAVQQVDDITAQEVEVGGVRGGVVAEGVSQPRLLHKDGAKTGKSDRQVRV